MISLFNSQSTYNEVHSQLLVNDQVTKANIFGLKDFFTNANANDVVLLFIAGHGVLDVNFDYFYCTHVMDFNDPAKFGLAMQN
ncbi:MAG: hypothetical protein ACI857_001813 [Arenicella sp.]